MTKCGFSSGPEHQHTYKCWYRSITMVCALCTKKINGNKNDHRRHFEQCLESYHCDRTCRSTTRFRTKENLAIHLAIKHVFKDNKCPCKNASFHELNGKAETIIKHAKVCDITMKEIEKWNEELQTNYKSPTEKINKIKENQAKLEFLCML